MNYVIKPFKNYFNIKDKANIKEFWIFFLVFTFVISPLIGVVKGLELLNSNLILVINIFFLIPFLTLGFRRLNETQFNKWLFLIPLVNLIFASFPPKQ